MIKFICFSLHKLLEICFLFISHWKNATSGN